MPNIFGAAKKPFQNLRFGASFPAPQPQQKGMPINGPLIQQQPEEDPLSMFKQPDSPALDAYKKYIATMPDRSNYEYGKKGKILAAIAGVSDSFAGGNGYQTTRNLLDDPYKTAMEDYSNKGKGMAELANIEDKVNQNQNDSLKNQLSYIKDTRAQDSLNTYRSAQIASLQDKANKAETIEQKHAFEIQMQTLRSADAKELERLRAADAGKNAVNLAGVNFNYGLKRDANNAELAKSTHEYDRKIDADNPIPQSMNDGISPTQQASGDETALSRVLLANPQYSKFIDRDPTNGAFKGYIIPAGSEQEYRLFEKAIGDKKREIFTTAKPTSSLLRPTNNPSATITNPAKGSRAWAEKVLRDAKRPTAKENVDYVLAHPEEF